ncbi:hypothetical protein VNO77_19487 [Canavalia gladiata]|uniref:Uncharacterized protein n=1 Tax=Canavalia gladiata TaxID=3824 RepID=A0AAN9QPN4_CANGL
MSLISCQIPINELGPVSCQIRARELAPGIIMGLMRESSKIRHKHGSNPATRRVRVARVNHNPSRGIKTDSTSSPMSIDIQIRHNELTNVHVSAVLFYTLPSDALQHLVK